MTSALLCSTAFYAVSSAAASFTRSGNFITVKVQQPSANAPRLVRLQVVGDKIIRVEATAKDAFPTKQSLIIVPQPTDQNFQISEDTRRVIVKTPFLSATVDKATGRVLVEVDPKYFRPAEVEQLLGDPTKAKEKLGWNPRKTTFPELVKIMIDHDMRFVKKLHLKAQL